MNAVKLSICIPTYNRSVYLDRTITSIVNQLDGEMAADVEICISDNASTDGTEEMIRVWQEKCPVRIVYSRNKENQGADRNYMRVIELASGEYCWYFGSDDLVAEGGLRHMLSEIQSGKDIYLCNRTECDINMRSGRKRFWLAACEPSQVFHLSEQRELLRYLKSAQSIGAIFSYLSSIVFKRERWQQHQIDPEFIGTAYSHVYMLLSIVKDGCDLVYLREPLVLCRGQNDSFESEGVVRRVMLDIDGYTLLAEDLYSEDAELKSAFLQVLKRERPPISTLIFVRLRTDAPMWRKLETSFRRAQYPRVLLKIIGLSKATLILIKNARRLVA